MVRALGQRATVSAPAAPLAVTRSDSLNGPDQREGRLEAVEVVLHPNGRGEGKRCTLPECAAVTREWLRAAARRHCRGGDDTCVGRQ